MSEALARLFGRAGEEFAGVGRVAGLLVVFGGGTEEVAGARPGQCGQPGRGLGMQLAPAALEQRVVGDVVKDLVAKRIFAHTVQARVLVRQRQFAPHESRQRQWRMLVQRFQRLVPEHQADHAGLLQREPFRSGQAVQPGLQHTGERGRNRGREQPLGVQRPALGPGLERALVDQHLDQLLHVERVALGAADDELAERRRDVGQLLQQLGGEQLAVVGVQRREVDPLLDFGQAAPIGSTLEQRRPGQAQQQHRHVAVDLGQVAQEIERAVVGPVQVVELQHDPRALVYADAPQHLCRGVEAAGADLARVVEDALDMPAVAEIQADQLAQQVSVRLRQVGPVVGDEKGCHAVLELVLRLAHAVAVDDVQPPCQHVAQQAERAALGLRIGPALEQRETGVPGFGPALELVQQPALADARVGDHGDGAQPLLDLHPLERVLQRQQLRVASDHAGLDALDAAGAGAKGARPDAQHQVGEHRLGHALHRQRRLGFDLEHAAHVAEGVLADAHAAGRRGLLHARRDIHRDAADRAVGVDPAAQQHRAGVQPDPHVEARVAVAARHLLARGPALGQQRQAAAHRTFGVVLARFVGAEDGEQVVARVLQHPAAMRLHHRGAARQGAVHDGRDFLRVQALAERGRADHVHEEDGDLLELLGHAAGHRRRGQGGRQCGDARAQRCDRQVDHRIAEQRALRLEGGQPRLQLFEEFGRRHGREDINPPRRARPEAG